MWMSTSSLLVVAVVNSISLFQESTPHRAHGRARCDVSLRRTGQAPSCPALTCLNPTLLAMPALPWLDGPKPGLPNTAPPAVPCLMIVIRRSVFLFDASRAMADHAMPRRAHHATPNPSCPDPPRPVSPCQDCDNKTRLPRRAAPCLISTRLNLSHLPNPALPGLARTCSTEPERDAPCHACLTMPKRC
jgi:hypothetical protein